MSVLNKFYKALRNPWLLIAFISRKLNIIYSDKLYLTIQYKALLGKWINWKDPQLYQEKLQWLKVYDRKPCYTKMVDKIMVKEYVANLIGEQYIIPTLGVWNKFDDINFDELPNQFVLKTNNGGGNEGVVICMDKKNFNYRKAKDIIESSLKYSIYKTYREWPYKNVNPKIFA